MGRRKYSTGVFRVDTDGGHAILERIEAKRKYSDFHSLTLDVYKFSPCKREDYDPDIFLTLVRLGEKNGKQLRNDVYSFNGFGRLLSHSFSLFRECAERREKVVGDKRDMSLERLKFHRLAIEEMLGSVLLNDSLREDGAVSNLIRGIVEG